mmetsp:Transcript_23239/g.22811  ORF Transcript_23239/g.22811 Transcript_23239/m.22811 type:complete len:207 (-) Transcript_23239:336-956(-)
MFKFLSLRPHIAIDWNNEFLEENQLSQAWHPTEHASVKQERQLWMKPLYLNDCLAKFSEVESINKHEGLYCESCKDFNRHIKRIDVQTLPPILIIHLKRFKVTAYGKQKVNNFINFPLYDLDMSQFIAFPEQYAHLPKEATTYDLSGVINHYGMMNAGHYISFVKNQYNNNWYSYDDSACKELLESQVRTEGAYILFYKRKDVDAK